MKWTHILMAVIILFVIFNFFKTGSRKVKENYGDNSGNGTIILFYADWCGHCKTFKPIWDKIKQSNNKYNFREIEHTNFMKCQKEIQECDQRTQLGYKDAPNCLKSLKNCDALKDVVPSLDKMVELLQLINGYPTIVYAYTTANKINLYRVQNRFNLIDEIDSLNKPILQ